MSCDQSVFIKLPASCLEHPTLECWSCEEGTAEFMRRNGGFYCKVCKEKEESDKCG